MKKTDFLEDRTEKGNCLVTSDSTDFFVVIHDRLLERSDVTEGDKKEHLEGFDDNRRKTNRKKDPAPEKIPKRDWKISRARHGRASAAESFAGNFCCGVVGPIYFGSIPPHGSVAPCDAPAL